MGIISVTTFLTVMSQYFDKSNPIVTTSSEKGPLILKYNLYRNMIFRPLALNLGINYHIGDHRRYVTIKAMIDNVVYDVSTHSYKIEPHLQFNYVPCNTLQDEVVRGFLDEVYPIEEFYKIFVCPDFRGIPDEFEHVDNLENLTYKWVSIHVFPCSNADSTECASAQELDFLRLDSPVVSKLLEPSNFKSPVKNFFVRRGVEIGPHVKKILHFDLKITK